MKRLFFIFLAVIAVMSAAIATSGSYANASTGFVTRSGQQLLLDGLPYRMVGFNLWRANVSFRLPNTGYLVNNGTTLSDALTAINANAGKKNVLRTWFFQQEVTPTTSGYNWAPFDKTLSVAAAHGFKVIPVLADEWNFEGPPQKDLSWYQSGYKTVVNRGTSNGVSYNENVSYRQYVQDVVSRYAGNPAIAAWELVNEAQDANSDGSCSSGAGSTMRAFADDVGGLIHSLDPNHLVSLGTAGNGQCGTLEGDYQTVMASSGIDLCSFHGYYGYSNLPMTNTYNGLNVRVNQCAALNKPLYVGEAGLHANKSPCNGSLSCRASKVDQQMTDVFADQGVQGYIPWQFDLRGISGSGDDYVFGPGDPVLPLMDKYVL